MRYCYLLLCLFFIACTNSNSTSQRRSKLTSSTTEVKTTLSGKVVKISDGDTFTLLADGNRQEKIRLHGIDCPEKKQDFGQVARQKLSDLVFGKQVSVKRTDTDRYGRTIAIVYTSDGVCVNEELLRLGLAWHYTQYDNNAAWTALQEEAKRQKLGLWSHPTPVSPWEWRKAKR